MIETLKKLRLVNATILIYSCWNGAAGFVVRCVLLWQVAEERKIQFLVKNLPLYGWMNSMEEPSAEARRWSRKVPLPNVER